MHINIRVASIGKPLFCGLFLFQKIETVERSAFMNLSEEAKAAKNAYMRKWRKANKNKVKEYNKRFWQRRAERMAITQNAEKAK